MFIADFNMWTFFVHFDFPYFGMLTEYWIPTSVKRLKVRVSFFMSSTRIHIDCNDTKDNKVENDSDLQWGMGVLSLIAKHGTFYPPDELYSRESLATVFSHITTYDIGPDFCAE